MERLKQVKETLMGVIEAQMAHIHDVDAQELGEAIDMIKDIEEAMYYCTIIEAMKEPPHCQQSQYEYPMEASRDAKEGRSPHRRKMYLEAKTLHHDKGKQMMELEKYMQDLTKDLVEMIEDSSPEEKQMLHQKIAELANKLK